MKKQAAIDYFGSASKVSIVLNISRQAVSKWPEKIPEKQALKLEKLTRGELRAGAYD